MYGVTSQHSKRPKNVKSTSRPDVSTFFCEQNKQTGRFQQLLMLSAQQMEVYIVQDERKFPLLSEVGYMSEWTHTECAV